MSTIIPSNAQEVWVLGDNCNCGQRLDDVTLLTTIMTICPVCICGCCRSTPGHGAGGTFFLATCHGGGALLALPGNNGEGRHLLISWVLVVVFLLVFYLTLLLVILLVLF